MYFMYAIILFILASQLFETSLRFTMYVAHVNNQNGQIFVSAPAQLIKSMITIVGE